VKSGICAAVILLAGVLAAGHSVAQENAAGAHDPANKPTPAGPQSSHPDQQVEKPARPERSAGDAPIDTSISVQPAHPMKRPSPSVTKPAVVAPVGKPTISMSPAMGGPARNAIGVAQDLHVVGKDIGGHGPANTPGTVGLGSPRPLPRPANPTVPGSAPQTRAGITGTGLSRPGYGPSTLGGPAKNGAGISGTGLRPKH
jgi:hypothetical protein